MSVPLTTPTAATGNSIVDTSTYAVSAGMATSPWWLPLLQSVSEGAATIAPILGAVWLVVQIWAKVSEIRNRKS